MTMEENLKLAEELAAKYSELEAIEKQIADNEKLMNEPVTADHKTYSRFHFFWPYLVTAAILLVVVGIILILIGISIDSKSFTIISYLVTGFAALVVGGYGWFKAGKKSDEANNKVSAVEEERFNRIKELNNTNKSLKPKVFKLKKEVSAYDELFPLRYRKSEYMKKICDMFRNGEAADFSEAVNLLKKNK